VSAAAVSTSGETGFRKCRGRALIGIGAILGGAADGLLVSRENTLAVFGGCASLRLLRESKMEMCGRNDSADRSTVDGDAEQRSGRI